MATPARRGSSALPPGRRTDAGRGLAEALHVGGMDLLPSVAGGPAGRGAVQLVLQGVEAGVPARRVSRRLAELVEGVEQDQRRARPLGLDLEAERVSAPGEFEKRWRLAGQDLALEPLGLVA